MVVWNEEGLASGWIIDFHCSSEERIWFQFEKIWVTSSAINTAIIISMNRPDFEAVDTKYKAYIQERSREVNTVLQSIPILDIDQLLADFDESKFTDVDRPGSKSMTFRMDGILPNQVITLKVMRTMSDEFDYYCSMVDEGKIDDTYEENPLSIRESIQYARDICINSEIGEGTELALRQIWGHTIGAIIMPDYIDPPAAIWVTHAGKGPDPIVIGYSLPFVEGRPVAINSDSELLSAADLLQTKGIYVGNRRESLNAVVDRNTGLKKFIDVEVRF